MIAGAAGGGQVIAGGDMIAGAAGGGFLYEININGMAHGHAGVGSIWLTLPAKALAAVENVREVEIFDVINCKNVHLLCSWFSKLYDMFAAFPAGAADLHAGA